MCGPSRFWQHLVVLCTNSPQDLIPFTHSLMLASPLSLIQYFVAALSSDPLLSRSPVETWVHHPQASFPKVPVGIPLVTPKGQAP